MGTAELAPAELPVDTTLPADAALFTTGGFDQALAQAADPLPIFRETLRRGDRMLKGRFDAGIHIALLVDEHARFIDQLLVRAWRIFLNPMDTRIALVAVGGYGRSELHLGSDIDLMILLQEGTHPEFRDPIERFLTFLWDMGVEVGHSVRTPNECAEQAAQDISIATNLLEARLLYGPAELFGELRAAIAPERTWSIRAYFESKLEEQQARHAKFHDTAYKLEPNVKESPGGLRDIQTISWVAKRKFDSTTLRDLVDHGFLTESEHAQLLQGLHFLWKVRFLLHMITGRREDRLLFDHQRILADRIGYRDEDHRLGVEQFMRRYYRVVNEISRLNEMLLQLFQEAIVYADSDSAPVPINRRFQVRNGYIEVVNEQVFLRYPFAMLEVFLLIQQNPEIQGVRASTVRLLRTYRELINDEFRADIRARSLFVEILRQPQGITHALRRMNRYGILEAYLPAFASIVGLMQYDLFHVYTVDEHSLTVVRNLRRFDIPKHFDEFPFCSQLIQRLPKIELLYVAGIFHDIAKGRGGDHAQQGAVEAREFCQAHGFGRHDTDLVVWLVQNHLILSMTAQRCDISDPEVVSEFAARVGDQIRLDYLYLLTVADIRATNPEIWNSWKATLLQELYQLTTRALRRGEEFPLDRAERIRGVKWLARIDLHQAGISDAQIAHIWNKLPGDYFLRYSPDEVVWHLQNILSAKEEDLPLVLTREDSSRGSSSLFIYTNDSDDLFAKTTYLLDQMLFNIVEARVISSRNGYTFDTFQLLEEDGQPITEPERAAELCAQLRKLIRKAGTFKPTERRIPRRLKHFPMETTIHFSQDESNNRTILELITADRPGLLGRIGIAFSESAVRLQNAKIITLGNRAEDVFFLTNRQGDPLLDAEQIEKLRQKIREELDA